VIELEVELYHKHVVYSSIWPEAACAISNLIWWLGIIDIKVTGNHIVWQITYDFLLLTMCYIYDGWDTVTKLERPLLEFKWFITKFSLADIEY